MTNLMILAIAGACIFGIARFNRSNKLFWQLLMSFVFGFACASVGNAISNSKSKKESTTISSPMHQSSPSTDIVLDTIAMIEETNVTSVTNYASQGRIDRDIVLCTVTPSAPLEENKGDPPIYVDTS